MKTSMVKLWVNLRSQPGMDEPLVRWGLVGIFLICFWFFAFAPYLDWRDVRQSSIDMQALKAAKTQDLKASSKAWKQSFAQHEKAMKTLTSALFQDSSYAGAQATLLKMMIGLLQAHHLRLDSQRLLDADVEKGFGQEVGVFLRAQGSRDDVLSFIEAVSSADKLIVLDKLYLGRGQGSAEMMLQFQVTGFRFIGQSL